MVDHLAERLSERGHHPAILTRGYRRRSIETSILVEAGEPAPVSFTGDEAQIFVQSGYAHSGIGADRFVNRPFARRKIPARHLPAGRRIPAHAAAARSGSGGDRCFESVRRRRGFPAWEICASLLSSLSRAGAFVIMRAAPEREYAGIRAAIAGASIRDAPIFRARLEHRYWVDYRTRQPRFPRSDGPVAAFCGLANPASFWGTLRALRSSAGVSLGVRRSSSLQLHGGGAPGGAGQNARVECAAHYREGRDEFAR